MALDATAIAALAADLKQAKIDCGAVDNPFLTALCAAEAAAIAEFVVKASVAVVTTCPAGAGTGTGTVT